MNRQAAKNPLPSLNMSLRMVAGFVHLRETMADILSQVVDFPPGLFVTVLAAKVTANSANARITLSVFPAGPEHEKTVLEVLETYRPDIKQELSERLKFRRIPNLYYAFDHTEAEAEGIEAALYKLKQEGQL